MGDETILIDAIELIVRTALAPVADRLRALEAGAGDVATLRGQVAALEALTPAPGPPGPPGPEGPPGMGFDDYRVEYDGERTFTHRWARGETTAESAIVVPMMLYRGVYVPGKHYDRGDCVTFGGSLWHANTATTIRPGDGPAWQLAVKRGRDASVAR